MKVQMMTHRSILISDLSYDKDDDAEDSLTTVTYMSDFTIFLDDSEDEDTLTTVTSLSNFTADLFDEDDVSLSDYSSDESLDDLYESEGGEEMATEILNLKGHKMVLDIGSYHCSFVELSWPSS